MTTALLSDAIDWADTATAGDYLCTYDDDGLDDVSDPGSRCGYGDDEIAQIEATLGARGLTLVADDLGLVAE